MLVVDCTSRLLRGTLQLAKELYHSFVIDPIEYPHFPPTQGVLEAHSIDSQTSSTVVEALLAHNHSGCTRSFLRVFVMILARDMICAQEYNSFRARSWPVRLGRPPCLQWQTVESFGSTATFPAAEAHPENLTAP